MLAHVLEVAIAPLLVGLASLVAVRFGPRAGGLVSAFPAIVGPFLLLSADRHGAGFAADAAEGTLLGLVSFAGFVVAYAWTATVATWPVSLLVAWAVTAGVTAALTPVQLPAGWSLLVCAVALVAAHRALPRLPARLPQPPPWWDVPLRMVLCAALVVLLAVVADQLGSGVGGLLAALPVLASILAGFTHHDDGAGAVVALLRGMLEGTGAFVALCVVVALAIQPWGIALAFAAAIGAAIVADLVTGRLLRSATL